MNMTSMIAELMALGLSQKAIAARAGVSQPTICRAARGGGILYEHGKAIERLHSELVTAPSAQAA